MPKKHQTHPVSTPSLPGLKPPRAFSLSAHATASQLHPITSLTDADLRNFESRTRPDGAPWFPKPALAKYETVATLRGLLEYERHRADRAHALPRQCASMRDVESVFGLPVEMQQYPRSHGCPEAFEASNRVNVQPLFKAAAPLLKKIFSGGAAQIKGIEGLEELDSDLQLARVRKEDADARARENAIANGHIHNRPAVEEAIWENGLSLVAMAWKRYPKEVGSRIRMILQSAGVRKETIDQVVQSAIDGVQNPLEKIRSTLAAKFPNTITLDQTSLPSDYEI